MEEFLCHLFISNLCILSVLSDGIQEIPFIKKALQEDRKKTWTRYSQKSLLLCVKYHRNILTIEANVVGLFKYYNSKKNEVIKIAKRKFR